MIKINKRTEVWKVTYQRKSWMGDALGKYCLSYTKGKTTVPKIGKIFCFRSKETALDLVNATNEELSVEQKVLETIGGRIVHPEEDGDFVKSMTIIRRAVVPTRMNPKNNSYL